MDESENTNEQAPAEDSKVDGNAGSQGGQSDKGQDLMIPKSRFDEVNEEAKRAKQELEELRNQQEAAKKKALEEQGEFKRLYEEQREAAEKLQKQLEEQQFNSLRREVATNAGYPALWNRIQGANAEELEADMKSLVDAMPSKRVPKIDARAGSGGSAEDVKKMSSDKKEYWGSILGVDPAHIPDDAGL